MANKRVFSGIQPTGNLHLGNYLGAILNWVRNQDEKDNIFCIVDEHAITVPQDPKELKKLIIDTAKIYLAAGIDPNKSSIFVQSSRPEHTELAWILNNFTSIGPLLRMTQFKLRTKVDFDHLINEFNKWSKKLKNTGAIINIIDKIALEEMIEERKKLTRNVVEESAKAMSSTAEHFIKTEYKKLGSQNFGLLDYPVLMAADILLYDTDEVPVGDDQKQHVEITRDIAERVNKRFDEKVFVIPASVINKESSRIMSLTNPLVKMSKSDENDNSRINITDSSDIIGKKFARAVTDSSTEIKFDTANKPGVSNLLNILSAVTQKPISELEKKYTGKNYGEFKADVAEAVANLLEPVQKRLKELDDKKVKKILEKGATKVAPTAQETLKRVKKTIGLGI